MVLNREMKTYEISSFKIQAKIIALVSLTYLIKFLDLILGILIADPNKLLPVMNIPLEK